MELPSRGNLGGAPGLLTKLSLRGFDDKENRMEIRPAATDVLNVVDSDVVFVFFDSFTFEGSLAHVSGQ